MSFDFQLDPLENFSHLLKSAEASGVPEPTAMALATASSEGEPSARMVLFKGFVRGGFSFYTNYDSPKAHELGENPQASLLFFWPQLAQQIRIAGSVELLTRAESEAYFRTRPRLSQVGAWASHQSEVIANFEILQKKVEEFEARFAGKDIPCPENWGGYRLMPLMMEFWFGRQGRLHERYVYERQDEGSSWRRFLKSP